MYIYKITNLINNKIYIGLTTKTIEERFKNHIYSHKLERHSHIKLYKAFKKYNIENFKVEKIDEAKNINCLNKKEIFWISKYNTTNDEIGYNMCNGGEATLGRKCRKETKEKISEKAKERFLNGFEYHNESSIEGYDENGTVVARFKSIAEASRYLNIAESGIRKSMKNNTKAKKYNWRKIEKINENEIINIDLNKKIYKFYKIHPLNLKILEKFEVIPKEKYLKAVNSEKYLSEGFRWVKPKTKIKFEFMKITLEKDKEKKEFLIAQDEGKKELCIFFNVKTLKEFSRGYRTSQKYKGYKIKKEVIYIEKEFN
ncbi:MAG: GIY-YIG nuclease family protein [Cetobacterium sp.]